MRRPQSRDRRRSGGSPPVGAVLGLVLVAAAFLAIFGVALMQHGKTVQTDPATLCPKTGPSALTVVLVDATDDMSAIQKAAVQTKLDQLVSRLREYEAIRVYSIDPGTDPLGPGFQVCRPRSPEETSDWTGNKAAARRQFDEVFRPRLRNVLAQAVARPSSDASPIMEAVQAVVVGAFQKADVAAGHTMPKRLVIVSDMLENGLGGSHYRGVPDFEAFRTTDAYRRLKAHMDGIDVDILYLGRSDAQGVQGKAHAAFWQDYFERDQHARVDDIYWIEG
jgi:hypothetical protein